MNGIGPSVFYDGTFEGLLSVAASLEPNSPVPEISSGECQPSLFSETVRIDTDREKARDYWSYLEENLSGSAIRNIGLCALSGEGGYEEALLGYIRKAFIYGKEIDKIHTDPHVESVHRIARKVGREIHGFKGLARFRKLKDSTLYAPMRPDHKILVPLSRHFAVRLRNERWILHDIGRDIALYWDGQEVHEAVFEAGKKSAENNPDPAEAELDSEELFYQKLWCCFHESVSIPNRRNPKLQRGLMPRRYWSCLTEKPRI